MTGLWAIQRPVASVIDVVSVTQCDAIAPSRGIRGTMGRLIGRGARSAERSTVSARLRSSRIVALVVALSILPLAGVLTATPPSAVGAVSTDYPSWQDVAQAQQDEKAAQPALQTY